MSFPRFPNSRCSLIFRACTSCQRVSAFLLRPRPPFFTKSSSPSPEPNSSPNPAISTRTRSLGVLENRLLVETPVSGVHGECWPEKRSKESTRIDEF